MDMGLKSVKQVFVCWVKLSHFTNIMIEKKRRKFVDLFLYKSLVVNNFAKMTFSTGQITQKNADLMQNAPQKVKQLRWLANATLLKALALFWSCFNSCLKSSIKTIEERPAMPERLWWHFQRHCSQLPLSSLTFNCYLVTWFIPLTKRSYL